MTETITDEIDDNCNPLSNKKPIARWTVEQLSKQCGITYRASENTLFYSGLQPFVVDVKIKNIHCIGTLISPMHVLTLASCFMLREVWLYLSHFPP